MRYCPFLYTQSLSLSIILSFVKFFLLCLIRAPSQSVWTWQLILHTLSLSILMGPAWLNFWGFVGDYLPTGPWIFEIIILKKEVSEGKLEYRRKSEQSATQSDFPMTWQYNTPKLFGLCFLCVKSWLRTCSNKDVLKMAKMNFPARKPVFTNRKSNSLKTQIKID